MGGLLGRGSPPCSARPSFSAVSADVRSEIGVETAPRSEVSGSIPAALSVATFWANSVWYRIAAGKITVDPISSVSLASTLTVRTYVS